MPRRAALLGLVALLGPLAAYAIQVVGMVPYPDGCKNAPSTPIPLFAGNASKCIEFAQGFYVKANCSSMPGVHSSFSAYASLQACEMSTSPMSYPLPTACGRPTLTSLLAYQITCESVPDDELVYLKFFTSPGCTSDADLWYSVPIELDTCTSVYNVSTALLLGSYKAALNDTGLVITSFLQSASCGLSRPNGKFSVSLDADGTSQCFATSTMPIFGYLYGAPLNGSGSFALLQPNSVTVTASPASSPQEPGIVTCPHYAAHCNDLTWVETCEEKCPSSASLLSKCASSSPSGNNASAQSLQCFSGSSKTPCYACVARASPPPVDAPATSTAARTLANGLVVLVLGLGLVMAL